MAMRDPLTGLHNRRAFEDQLARAISAAARHGEPLAMVIIDVDRFKAVNDTHGHQVGDMVLIELAHRLANIAREEEPIARLGGEEFVWLLPGVGANEAMAAAERARIAVASVPFATVGPVTVSAGIAELDAALGAEALFRRADDALYAAKDAGRNRCVVWAGEREPA
jgi:diguanylate cyclase (GGDEF)-like protein